MAEEMLKLPDGSDYAVWEDLTEYKRELHVDNKNPAASDDNPGTPELPFKTVGRAAETAEPGDKVVIHGGIYRECVRPRRGGNAPDSMIMYEAAEGEDVEIRGSVVVNEFRESKDWTRRPTSENTKKKTLFYTEDENRTAAKIWEIKLAPEDFKEYNPFALINMIHDRLFIEYGKTNMTSYINRRGMVFVDGVPMKQKSNYYQLEEENSYWVEEDGMKIHIRLKNDEDPHDHLIEITNREQCFAPAGPFLNYIHVKGIRVNHAANGGPVPQKGAISCRRGHHWIIEGCTVDWANALGIDCGNECWNHPLHDGQILGHSIIRGNRIFHAGVCGIAAIGADQLLLEDNWIEGTGWQRMELSWEAAGIKLHNAVNTLIRRNVVTDSIGCDSLWLDLQNCNTRITNNVFLNGIDSREHLFIECSRDSENLIDHNIIWGVDGRYDRAAVPDEPGSTGWYKLREHDVENGYGIYLEGTDRLRVEDNLIGCCNNAGFYAKPTSFRMSSNRGGTAIVNKIYSNVFYDCREAAIKFPTVMNEADRNVYINEPAGFLRIIYPEPEMCLDLPAWQEFLGFDKNGEVREADIDIDRKQMEMTVSPKGAPLKIMDMLIKEKTTVSIDPRIITAGGKEK